MTSSPSVQTVRTWLPPDMLAVVAMCLQNGPIYTRNLIRAVLIAWAYATDRTPSEVMEGRWETISDEEWADVRTELTRVVDQMAAGVAEASGRR